MDVDHFNDIPDNLKLKAHAVCLYNGKILLVHHPEWGIWSIPGGTRERGESIEETLVREILEEANCKVIDCQPIAFQKVVNPSDETLYYRLQYFCNVIPVEDFKEDPAGNIDKIAWIQPRDFELYIENKEFKIIVIRRALELLKNMKIKKLDKNIIRVIANEKDYILAEPMDFRKEFS
ncbi:MAG: NUDIX hydrolase [bacterium]|nr:NUDIX hydrolase [bacterium]